MAPRPPSCSTQPTSPFARSAWRSPATARAGSLQDHRSQGPEAVNGGRGLAHAKRVVVPVDSLDQEIRISATGQDYCRLRAIWEGRHDSQPSQVSDTGRHGRGDLAGPMAILQEADGRAAQFIQPATVQG